MCGITTIRINNAAELTQNGFESAARTKADGRTINTANIGTNRPAYQPKIFVNELHAIVLRWADEHWSQPYLENPSHTNGAFWGQITTWLHATNLVRGMRVI